jgi:hypothetical protein
MGLVIVACPAHCHRPGSWSFELVFGVEVVQLPPFAVGDNVPTGDGGKSLVADKFLVTIRPKKLTACGHRSSPIWVKVRNFEEVRHGLAPCWR